jgi:adenylate kinase
MFNLIIFGPPGAGKGTQALKVKETFHLTHISTGEMIRREMLSDSALGQELKSFVAAGKLIPDELATQIIKAELLNQKSGFIFDGFPRTEKQARDLDSLLSDFKEEITLVISLEVSRPELIKRLLLRGKESGRIDDNQETIEARLQIYSHETEPLLEYYRTRNKLAVINGEGEITEISERIKAVISNLIK